MYCLNGFSHFWGFLDDISFGLFVFVCIPVSIWFRVLRFLFYKEVFYFDVNYQVEEMLGEASSLGGHM